MRPHVPFSSEPAAGWLPWAALAPLLGLAFVAAPLLGVSLVLERLQLLGAKGDPTGFPGLLALLLFPFAGIGLVVLGWVRFVERRSPASIGLPGPGLAPKFLRGHAIGVATSLSVVAAIWAAGGLEADGYARALASPAALAKIGLLLLGFAVQASVEEILFRGWLLSAMARKVHLAVAVGAVSTLFALLHYGPRQPWLVTANLLLFGAFTCLWALAAGHLWGVMGWHAGWNWMLATGFELPLTGLETHLPAALVRLKAVGPAALTGGAQGPEGSLLCTAFFVCAIGWLARRRLREDGGAAASPAL